MKVALFGSTGQTGRLVLKNLLEKNIEVHALVRKPSKLNIEHPLLKITVGDVQQFDKVFDTIKGTEAVISVIGYVRDSKAGFQSIAMQNMIRSMEELNIMRIIALTGTGVSEINDRQDWSSKLLTFLIKTISPARYKDGIKQLEILKQTSLDWTLVRVPLLTNGQPRYAYKEGNPAINFLSHISRADVAHFIVKILIQRNYIQQAPIISY